jgi:hypothetical protein
MMGGGISNFECSISNLIGNGEGEWLIFISNFECSISNLIVDDGG